MAVTVRKLQISDYDAAYALWLSCEGMGLNDIDDSREGIDRFLRRNPQTCFAAVDGDRLCGVILARTDLVYRNRAVVELVRIDT